MLPTTGCAVLIIINPSGPLHSVVTVTGISTDGLNTTVQVRIMVDPIKWMGLVRLGTIVTDVGAGTVRKMLDGYSA